MSLVRDVLAKKQSTEVTAVTPQETVLEAARRMHDRRIGAVLVVEDGRIAGIFTERDLLNRVVAENRDAENTPVGEVMTDRVAFCTRDTPLESCRAIMTRHKLRHLPVVENGRLLGMISSGDILARELQDHEETIRYLHEYMHGMV
jgi:CBS domain-containing protein